MVADSSYVVDRLLRKRAEFVEEQFMAPDILVPEVVNAILVQQRVFHRLEDGLPYMEAFFDAVDVDSLRLVKVTGSLAGEAYEIALRNNEAIYDCLFVALALSYGEGLKTNDRRQARVYEKELEVRGRGDAPLR